MRRYVNGGQVWGGALMSQVTLSVALEVKPQSAVSLSALVDQLHDRYLSPTAGFAEFMSGVPVVHFLSLSVFPGADFDPLFVLEANFDGAASVFWGQLEAAIGEDLRAMLRCCKAPLDQDAALFEAVTAANSRAPVAPYFEARAGTPTVFHHGNRGMTRDRILAEAKLFGAIRTALETDDRFQGAAAIAIHDNLRAALLPAFAWLNEPSPPRITHWERICDIARLLGFVMAVVFVLALPGLIGSAIMPMDRYLLLVAAVGAAVWVGIYRLHEPLPGTATDGKINLLNLMVLYPVRLALILLVGVIIVAPGAAVLAHFFVGVPMARLLQAATIGTLLALVSVIFVIVPGIVLWLRVLERRDSSHDAPPVDEDLLRQMAQREDWIPQNHMGSAVLVRPGILRMIVIRAGHLGLGLFLRVVATDGYLGSMRTVHFAHWAFANNRSRLLFFSNFDQSWESYLDDFIEKAHEGLTLAWGCGVGFPVTRFLIQDGASNGRQFKAWARHSMTVSRFWYSAYPDLTVDQIERNNRVADGLRAKSLSEKEASAWLNDL